MLNFLRKKKIASYLHKKKKKSIPGGGNRVRANRHAAFLQFASGILGAEKRSVILYFGSVWCKGEKFYDHFGQYVRFKIKDPVKNKCKW